MSSLIPEKRFDKNGVLTTRHVRPSPQAGKGFSGVPAPSLDAGAVNSNKKPVPAFKPRASQLKQERYAFRTTMNRISDELLADSDWEPADNTHFVFIANEVEVYAVLSVAQPGDAAMMLSRGVRTAEDALAYLRDHGAEHRAVKRVETTADALKRGISSYEFMTKVRLAIIAHPDDDNADNVMDVMELSTISSLAEQWGMVAAEVRSGVIRLEDIKFLGVSKLKSFRRLVAVREALQAVHKADSRFSMDDLKYIVDRAARDSLKEEHFRPVVDYLVAEGVDGLKRVDSLKMIRLIAMRYRYGERFQRATYEINFREVYKQKPGASFPDKELIELFDAGVPADRAAELTNEGMTVSSIVGVVVGGAERAIADGWL